MGIGRIIAALFISVCGLALSALTLFVFFWDNKGAKSIWDKSAADWLFFAYLFLAACIIWYAALQCITAKDEVAVFWLSIGILLFHLCAIPYLVQGVGNMYLGVPNLSLGIGLWIWYRAMQHHNRSQQNTDSVGG